MTPESAAPSVPSPSVAPRARARKRPVAVQVLVCGSADRSDDGAPIAAAGLLPSRVPDDVAIRIVGQLDIDDLLAIPAGAGVVIVDSAVGIHAGQVVEIPLNGLIGREDRLRPRSSHALSFPEVVALADVMRGRPLHGRIVAVGGTSFGLGVGLSARVAKAIPTLVATIVGAIERARA
jgi:hydrogenase maturation protease